MGPISKTIVAILLARHGINVLTQIFRRQFSKHRCSISLQICKQISHCMSMQQTSYNHLVTITNNIQITSNSFWEYWTPHCCRNKTSVSLWCLAQLRRRVPLTATMILCPKVRRLACQSSPIKTPDFLLIIIHPQTTPLEHPHTYPTICPKIAWMSLPEWYHHLHKKIFYSCATFARTL